ncbi:hypothetical protein [Terasakiella sp. SH-1]|uniref:hypothetical protein n=1 Tax=Terasakiella sp. SH-1 TaxID=2560057 RepID=UPI001074139B|nr:hypothetical protein [Terasakiella sp. SH-1]
MTHPPNKQAQEIFKALNDLDQIMGHGQSQKAVTFSELYAYATNPAHTPSEALVHALSTNLKTRRDLRRLLDKQAISFIPRAVAASSGELVVRDNEEVKLSLTPSKSNPDQVYLLIQSYNPELSLNLLFIEQEDGPILRLVIDDFFDGEAQILLFSDDEIVKALRNVKSEVILR